jgi:hypothetical protein
MHFAPVHRHALIVFSGLTLCLGLFSAGCSSSQAELSLTSTISGKTYCQPFSRAFVRRTDAGDFDAVLVDDGFERSEKSIFPFNQFSQPAADAPISSSNVTPLKQVVHVRMLWKPERGTRPGQPSGVNAVIDWYVMPTDAAHQQDFLHYQGSGFVMVYGDDDEPRIWIRNATVALKDRSGNMNDPLGKTKLDGMFNATRNDAYVTAVIDQCRHEMTASASDGADSAIPAFDSPPSRPPSP